MVYGHHRNHARRRFLPPFASHTHACPDADDGSHKHGDHATDSHHPTHRDTYRGPSGNGNAHQDACDKGACSHAHKTADGDAHQGACSDVYTRICRQRKRIWLCRL